MRAMELYLLRVLRVMAVLWLIRYIIVNYWGAIVVICLLMFGWNVVARVVNPSGFAETLTITSIFETQGEGDYTNSPALQVEFSSMYARDLESGILLCSATGPLFQNSGYPGRHPGYSIGIRTIRFTALPQDAVRGYHHIASIHARDSVLAGVTPWSSKITYLDTTPTDVLYYETDRIECQHYEHLKDLIAANPKLTFDDHLRIIGRRMEWNTAGQTMSLESITDHRNDGSDGAPVTLPTYRQVEQNLHRS